ncbi:hypothetical protein D5018_03885 [Parashewanella curva]|uniref:Uncharacterized protein n=1 Tax=Parashewanella curva TaxID=2338552 RepID=A0A3L8Q334_9GAMM|nr:hypothetical protein [Parashewanella curva]RLV60992.1 hypothetical protein D5018_03885 [Parashewanella curva]
MGIKSEAWHEWDDYIEKCIKCGDDFDLGNKYCSESKVNNDIYIVVAGKYEDSEHGSVENCKYISNPMSYSKAKEKEEEMSGYPFCRIEIDSNED